MEFYLKTKEECDKIVENSEGFFRADRVVEGYNVALYDYRLASISDFVDNEAFELRGLCFVEQPDGTWKRNILMQKFFNVNQTVGWMLEDVQNKKITRVQNKEDGSIISFVKFPNGKVRAKSKMSFESDQAQMAQEIYDTNVEIKEFVNSCFEYNYVPIFELVGFQNQIVLNYDMASELILLQIRTKDGMYFTKQEIKNWIGDFNITVTEDFDVLGNNALTDLLELKETSQDPIEGWVVTFEDGQMAKIKTNKYLELHGLIGPDAFRENLLVQSILSGSIDDVVSALVPGPKKDSILKMEKSLSDHFNHLVVEFKELRRKYFQDFGENRKEFSLVYSPKGSNPAELFSGVMKTLKTSFREVENTAEEQVKLHILTRCNSLGKAQDYLENLND